MYFTLYQSVAMKFELNVHLTTHIYNHYLEPHWRLQIMIAHRSSVLTQAMINLIDGLCTLPGIAMKFTLRVTFMHGPRTCMIQVVSP